MEDKMEHKEDFRAKWCEFAGNTSTFLSPTVQNLFHQNLQDSSIMHEDSNHSSCISLFSNHYLLYLFSEDQDTMALHPTERSADWYRQKIHDTTPIIVGMRVKLSQSVHEDMEQLVAMCSWLHQQTTIETCFKLLFTPETGKEKDYLYHYECLLLVTAMLERGLGNLYMYVSPNKKVPSLLRDLLASEELLLMLGQPTVGFLQLLLGSPLSLNIRNLSWHGFVQCGDFKVKDYASVLLVMCSSIGSHLKSNHSITSNNIVPRRWASLNRIPPKFMEVSDDELVDIVSNTHGLPAKRKPVWLQAIKHHQEGNNGRCCVLILPEMEHVLRMIYCSVNNCPARLLTAESVVHYTTLDTILDAGSENRLPDFLGKSLFAALVDVFAEDEGPRLRDRFSHGECLLQAVGPVLSQHLLALSAAILRLADDDTSRFVAPEYSPHYSLAAVFKRELLNAQKALGELVQVLDGATVEPLALDLSAWPAEHRHRFESWLAERSQQRHEAFTVYLANKHFNRTTIPRSNTWRQLMRRVSNGCKSMAEYKKSTSDAPPLRSRQRATLARFNQYLPGFVRCAQLALLLPTAAFLGGDLFDNDDDAVNRQSIKLQKCAARWADNLASNALDKRWNELNACTQQLEACFSAGLPLVFEQC